MSEIQEWYYKGKSDMSFGAKVNSPLPKIIAIFSVLGIITICGACFILRDYLYDIAYNPQLVLYTNQNENGYFLNILYKYAFHPENYIDENNTLKYVEFMDPNNTEYTYSISGSVNTSAIGDYTLTYTSQNKMQSQEIHVVVHVKDLTAPVVKLNSTLNEGGEYDPIVLIRGTHNTEESLGTLDFNADEYVLEVTDDYDQPENIRQENTGNEIDLENGSGTKTYEIIYTAVDKAGNSSAVILPLTVMDEYDAAAEAQKERIAEMELELNCILNGKPLPKKEEDEVIEEPVVIEMTADDFTWSLDSNTDDFVINAMNNIHYNGEGTIYAVSGAFITDSISEAGTYTVNWSTTDGYTCVQNIIVTGGTTEEINESEQ